MLVMWELVLSRLLMWLPFSECTLQQAVLWCQHMVSCRAGGAGTARQPLRGQHGGELHSSHLHDARCQILSEGHR